LKEITRDRLINHACLIEWETLNAPAKRRFGERFVSPRHASGGAGQSQLMLRGPSPAC
jgi:hypothetical protein